MSFHVVFKNVSLICNTTMSKQQEDQFSSVLSPLQKCLLIKSVRRFELMKFFLPQIDFLSVAGNTPRDRLTGQSATSQRLRPQQAHGL